MSIAGERGSFKCEKLLKFATRFRKLKKTLTMVFELMIYLCIEICSNFFTFSIPQLKPTSSKSAIETLEKGVKYIQS